MTRRDDAGEGTRRLNADDLAVPAAREAPRPAPLDAAAIVRRARRLRFRVRPDAVSQLAGAYHGARPGIGLTFAELRAYEPGDDVRHLDWNVTARQGRPFVRRFVEERALCLWLVVDVSASMRFGPERKTKADRAAQAAALLATAAVQNGDRAGLILVSDRIEVELAPAGGVRHLSQLVRALVATPTTSPKTKLSVGLARVRRTARRAMVVVISDFITEEPVATWRRARADTTRSRCGWSIPERTNFRTQDFWRWRMPNEASLAPSTRLPAGCASVTPRSPPVARRPSSAGAPIRASRRSR